MKILYFYFALLLLVGCTSVFRPYPCGPILDKTQIQIFKKQSDYLNLQPGTVFADIGASSGYHDGAMAVFLDSVTFYLNDIDHHCLNKKNLTKVLRYYSKLKGRSIEETNDFHYVIGTPKRTNLPLATFDVIFTNATLHVLDYPDSILSDVYKNLKTDGSFYIRDEIVENGIIKSCSSKKCGHQLLQHQQLMDLTARNGFELTGESHAFGHPIYKFSKKHKP